MNEFFARLYEWFGLLPLYSPDLGAHLRGMDYACTGYWAIPWYSYVGLIMIITTILIFGLQYDLISSKRFTCRIHWGLAALLIFLTNLFVAFTLPYMVIMAGTYCPSLKLSIYDCVGFGLSNAIWSLILFGLLSSIGPLINLIRGINKNNQEKA